jgi:hypothetical protein
MIQLPFINLVRSATPTREFQVFADRVQRSCVQLPTAVAVLLDSGSVYPKTAAKLTVSHELPHI